jgi:predicted metal-dependent peptidase
MQRIAKLRSRLLLKAPFFGSLLMAYPLVETPSIPTAATDMQRIYYNPDFFETLTDGQVIFVLAHEVMHIAFKHGLRVQSRDRMVWNWACDYAINWILHELKFELTQGGLLDQHYADMSSEHIYDLLVQDGDGEQSGSAGGGDDSDQTGGAGGDDDGEDDGDGDDDQSGGGAPLRGAETAGGMGRDLLPTDHMSPDEKAAAEQQATRHVAQAAQMARMAGKLPAALDRAVTGILHPDAPIEEVLRQYMMQHDTDDEDWGRRNRRFSDVYLPARHNDAMGEVVVIGDTSGSVTDTEINQIAGMVHRIAENMRPERVRMVWADATVAGEQVFERGEPLDFQPAGGGGTDMRVPLTHVEQYDPVVVVLVTDGCTPWPQHEPPYPLIVCCTEAIDIPIGEVIRI